MVQQQRTIHQREDQGQMGPGQVGQEQEQRAREVIGRSVQTLDVVHQVNVENTAIASGTQPKLEQQVSHVIQIILVKMGTFVTIEGHRQHTQLVTQKRRELEYTDVLETKHGVAEGTRM